MSLLRRDKRVQFAAVIGLLEWIIAGGLVVILEEGQRWLIGPVLAVSTLLQLSALLGRSAPQDAFSKAQAAFMAGDCLGAVQQLEAFLLKQPDHWQAQTLLGNAYRQLGQLEQSAAILQGVLTQHPQADFPLYGLGRTLLAQGEYQAAAELIEQALAQGGRKAIRAELALALYLANQPVLALPVAQAAARQLQLEPYRVLMVNYLLRQLAQDQPALAMLQRSAEAGLPYWQAEAQRFAHTPYGERLAQEIGQIQALIAMELPKS